MSVLALRGSPIAEELSGDGVPVTTLDVKDWISIGSALSRISKAVKGFQPDVIQG